MVADDKGLLVIFLDIDGVICCNEKGRLESEQMQQLARIVRDTGAKVCISSNWRLYDELRTQLYGQLVHWGIECIGTTPDAGEATHGLPMRPCEIKAWVDEWDRTAPIRGRPRVSQFVAIDDRESASAIETFDAEKRERTDFNTGISSKNCLDFFF